MAILFSQHSCNKEYILHFEASDICHLYPKGIIHLNNKDSLFE
ncbi:hypothetical protein RPN58_04095 [Staphylococcus arlettae]|nr:hypothetical protein [Staphylococcus arlettae]